VGETSTLHLERSAGGAEYVFFPASKPSLGSSSPAGRGLATDGRGCGGIVGICECVTVGGLELEGLAVLVSQGVGGGVEGHAAGEDERLCGCC
jgi:hypothetical protein